MKKRVLSFMLACFMVMSTFIIVPATVHAEEPVTQWTLPTDFSAGATNGNFTLKVIDRMDPSTTYEISQTTADATATTWIYKSTLAEGEDIKWQSDALRMRPFSESSPAVEFTADTAGVYSFSISATKPYGSSAYWGSMQPNCYVVRSSDGMVVDAAIYSTGNNITRTLTGTVELVAGEKLTYVVERTHEANNEADFSVFLNEMVITKTGELAESNYTGENAVQYTLPSLYEDVLASENFALKGCLIDGDTYTLVDLDEEGKFLVGETSVAPFKASGSGILQCAGIQGVTATNAMGAIVFTAPEEGLYNYSQLYNKFWSGTSGEWVAAGTVAGYTEAGANHTENYRIVHATDSGTTVLENSDSLARAASGINGSLVSDIHTRFANTVYLKEGESLYFLQGQSSTAEMNTGFGSSTTLSVTRVTHDCAAEDLTLVEAKAATCLETGISTTHYACGCGRTFLNADATEETTEDYTVSKLDHVSDTYLTTSTEHWKVCSNGCAEELEGSRGYHTVTDGACTVCGWTVPSGANKVGITLVNTGEIKEGEKVTVNVVVADAYAASKIVINFNKTYLTFNEGESTLGDAEVVLGNGTITILDHGAVKDEAIDYVLVFDAILFTPDAEYATVDLVAAGFSTQEDAEVNNLGGAELDAENKNISTAIIKADHEVSFETGEVELNTLVSNPVLRAPDAKDYTFTVIAPENYTYTVTATMGGVDVDAANITYADGVYTVKNVLGDLVISVSRTPNVYENSSVTIPDGAVLPEGRTNPTSATYGTNFVFYIPADIAGTPGVNGTDYEISAVTVNGEAYDVAKVVKVSDTEYYVPGADIAGDVAVTVTATATDPSAYTVNYTADGFGGVSVESSTVAVDGTANAVLNIVPEMGYTYTVTATMGGNTATVVTSGNTYTIEGVTGNVMFTVTRAIDTSNLEVGETAYVQLNGTALWLITVESEKLPAGKIYTYGGQTMFYSEQYDAYCILVVSATRPEELETLAIVDGEIDGYLITEAEYASYDVNMTGLTDINDAQLVYNMYMANADETYTDFTANVTMGKYLRADTNNDRLIDVNDAAAIVNYLVG